MPEECRRSVSRANPINERVIRLTEEQKGRASNAVREAVSSSGHGNAITEEDKVGGPFSNTRVQRAFREL